ncbi:MAG: UDP-N-acetylmuramoyl-L-alanine--D-glutamate ligase [Thermodesulfobacteriota bacterium]|nr:UDP-N-acetylmuramoyl-L-alanine--D-glutamate ligase [Thermodesulfobacteriota bacterium]
MELKGKKIVVVGAGLSGLAVCRYAVEQGAQVVLSDRRSAAQIDVSTLDSVVVADFGQHTASLFTAADLIVISPGVPLTIAPLIAAQCVGVPIIGEIELATRQLHPQTCMMAITGTNGKSTTTELLGAMLARCGKQVFVGGNLGMPLISAVDNKDDYAVVELSSFQLETVDQFRPRYAALLNLSVDHLDRYPDMTSYMEAKRAIFANQGVSDVAILNADDAEVLRLAKSARGRKVLFSSTRVLECGMSYHHGLIEWRGYGADITLDAGQLQLSGVHNIENVMAALIPALLEGLDPAALWQAACAFTGLAHRMVLVRQLDGVRWYNDSKGTNPGSVIKSVTSLATPDAPVTLIAGGKDKGGDYRDMSGCLRGLVAQFILIGEAAQSMEQAWCDLAPIQRVATMEQAVQLARQITPEGGSVLLSPGCSSFDMFRSFEHRGEVFSAAVMALQANGGSDI